MDISCISLGGAHILEQLRRAQQQVSNLEPAMRDIAAVLHDEIEQNFADQGRPNRWLPWAPATQARRKSGMILQDRGRLAASLNTAHGNDWAAIGSNLVYARIHHLGGQAGRNHSVTIPARPYFYISDFGWDEIGDAIDRHVTSALSG